MARCTLCDGGASLFTRRTFDGLSGYVCSECGDHILSLRNCYCGSENSIPHIAYLNKLTEAPVSPEAQKFIMNELSSHKNHVKTAVDSFVEDKLSSEPICTSNYKLTDGLPDWPKDMLIITAELYDDCIMFWKTATSRKLQSPAILKLTSILYAEHLTNTEIIEKSKSVVGRAAAGGLLFGPVGALIGGMSGVGSSQKKKLQLYYVIHFTNSLGEEAIITLETGCMGCHDSAFSKALSAKMAPTATQSPTFL